MFGEIPEGALGGEHEKIALAQQIVLHHRAFPRAPTLRLRVRHRAVRPPHRAHPRRALLHSSPRLLAVRQHKPPHRPRVLRLLRLLRPLLRDLHEPIHVPPPQKPAPAHVSLQQPRPHVQPNHVDPRPAHGRAELRHGALDFGLRLHDVDEEELQKAVVDVQRAAVGAADDAVGAQPASQRGVVHEAVVDAAGATQDEEVGGMVAVEQLGNVRGAVVVEFSENRVGTLEKACELGWRREKERATRGGERVVLEREREELVEDFPVVHCAFRNKMKFKEYAETCGSCRGRGEARSRGRKSCSRCLLAEASTRCSAYPR